MEKQEIRQAVILAGGRGTRLQPFTDHAPKPMYPICGKPFIGYLVEQIHKFGIDRILILTGYLSECIETYLGNGADYGVEITYDATSPEFQTGDRLIHAKKKLDEVFLLMYCDNYCPISYGKLYEDFFKNDSWIQISVYENGDEYTKSNVRTDESGRVVLYDKERKEQGLHGVDIGYAIVRKDILENVLCSNQNFESAAYTYAVEKHKLYATITKHRYYSIGSWKRIERTERFFENKPTVFLDRDGTINRKAAKACYIENREQFFWLEGAREAIVLLKEKGYRVLLITNQPGVARGNLTTETLADIHSKLQEDLRQVGTEVDRIYVCPHGWDEGCECRKPKPGMLYQAQKNFDLNLMKCVLIGDDERDIEAGLAAGCQTYQVTEERSLLQIVRELVGEE